MTVSLAHAWPALVRRGPSIVRRLRLISGLILFTYVFLHFVNHSLGNISFEAMEQGAVVQEWIWRSAIGTTALYGGFAIHFSLAFWALYIRRSIRMGWIEALRLALGFAIPLVLLQHALAWRLAYTYFDVHLLYRHALLFYFTLNPTAGIIQLTLFFLAWTHGCIGLYLWLRVKRHFHRVAPILLVVAVLLPSAALLGVFQGARQVAEKARTDPAFTSDLRQSGMRGHPAALAAINSIENWSLIGYAGAFALLFLARGARTLLERRGGTVRIAYPDGRGVRIS